MKQLILVDFDKTLYKKDSLLEFTKFYKGKNSYLLGLIILFPFLFIYKLKIYSGENTKGKFMRYFFKGENYIDFQSKANEFACLKIDKDINQKYLSQIKSFQKQGAQVYIVTASFNEWISAWATSQNIKIIATEMEVLNGIITGNLVSKNCNHYEKVNRIKKEINLEEFDRIIVYGEGDGDIEMHQLSK